MFEKYAKMSKNELEKELLRIEDSYKELLNEEKKIDRKIKRNLWLWFIFPFFGLFIYGIHLKKRRESDKNYYTIKAKKKDLIYVELEIQFLKSKIEKM
ncbi:hypothetical protein [Spiroplasma monobiae]|uniref:Uncharacterized protein n=1 Tax=Spiroplasma monobiae MQ-1 TaxID=1336748 RepID=A0A2K9LW99_SPISQ|nr:hypothetical protein [Spiroplasma monobiae]AUM62665.1 hypothetical protein SMONO_v1c04160 [Spiroplasma monobiae MQ-1]